MITDKFGLGENENTKKILVKKPLSFHSKEITGDHDIPSHY